MLIGYRNACGLTQEMMADKLNIKANTYHLKENGKRAFNREEMQKIKEVFIEILDKPLTIDEIFF